MNERELRILHRFVDSLRAIQQDIHSIYEETRAQHNKQDPPQQTNAQIGVRLPPPVHDYYASEERERPRNTRRDQIRLLLESIAHVAALLAAGFTFFTLREIRQQTEFAEGQNRPWLKIEDITTRIAGDPKIPILSFMTLPTVPKPYNGLSIQMEFHIRNIGKGVAQNIYIRPRIIFDSERSPSNLIGDKNADSALCPKRIGPRLAPRFIGRQYFQEMNLSVVSGQPNRSKQTRSITSRIDRVIFCKEP